MDLDYFELVKKSKSLDTSACKESLKIALLGDTAMQQLAVLLKVLFAERGIKLEVYEGPIDATELQVYDPSSGLYQFAPDLVVVLNSVQALKARFYKRPGSGAEFLATETKRATAVWDAIRKHTSVPVVQSTHVLPLERTFGNFDHKVADSLYAVTAALNVAVTAESRTRSHVFINDVEAIASNVGRSTWFENRLWNMYKVFCALQYLPLVAKNILDVALSVRGRAIKCVVLDLDNTLWGGVIGDDGVDGIQLSAHGDGEAFYDFQCFLRELQKRGILLAVCSKNNPENAIKPFEEHPEMVLKRDHITVFTANWQNKADNIKKIRETLNIGFDSMVFLDDNPFERNLVKSLVPNILVPELPEEPSDYVRAICELNLFETSSFSAEDAQRTELYRARAEAAETQNQFSSVEEYLTSLEQEINVARWEPKRLPRISQLFQRSNQFNLMTERRTEGECEALMNDERAYPIFAELKDKLGDHGLIGMVVARHRDDDIYLSDWLMSCRVLTRGVEQYLMNHCVEYAKGLGKNWISAEYRPTAKNAMVKDFYAQFGFEKVSESPEGNTSWRLDVSKYKPITVYMRAAAPAAQAS